MNDLRFALRQFVKAPGFTLIAVLTLALGIGVNTAVFSAFKGVVLRPLPGVEGSRELVTVLWTTRGGDKLTLSRIELEEFRERTQTLSGLEGTAAMAFSLDHAGRAMRVWGEYTSGGLHGLLGVRPALGRMLRPDDDIYPGAEPVMVLSHRYWQSQFGGNPDVIGRGVLLNGRSFTVVGVAEPGFIGTTVGFGLDVFVPVSAAEHLRPFGGTGSDLFTKRGSRMLASVARLGPGVSMEQARAEIAAIGAAVAAQFPGDYEGKSATLVSILDSPFGAQTYLGPVFGMMMGMTALVLLIMCSNVANLLLARASSRSHELAIRSAVGASRMRLMRQLLTEGLVLALLGGGLGGFLAWGTPDLLRRLWPETPRIPIVLNAEPDATVLLFALMASLASALLFAVIPALQASRQVVLPVLKTGRANGSSGRTWGRNALVVAQIAIAIPLLVAAGLLLRSAQRQQTANLGFDPAHVALMSLDLRPNGYDHRAANAFCERLMREFGALPGVESVSLANQLPVQTVPRLQTAIQIPGYTRSAEESNQVLLNAITPDYFRTLRIPLAAGREFTGSDDLDSARVAIINETMARRYWPDQDPIGRSFEAYGSAWRVVGVARDVKYLTPAETPRPHFYLPQGQFYASDLIVQVRTHGDARAATQLMADRIARIDPHLPVFGVETMEDYMEFALSVPAFAANGLAIAGALGLTLTAMGMFGTVSYTVGMRTREIGVRVALGAKRGDVVRLVVGQALGMVGLGAALGLMAAAAATQVLRALLFETSTSDPATYVVVLALVGGTSLLACWLPARRATRVDPMVALRAE